VVVFGMLVEIPLESRMMEPLAVAVVVIVVS